MKSVIFLTFLSCILLLSCAAPAQEWGGGEGDKEAVIVEVDTDTDTGTTVGRMKIKKRRELGLTIRNIAKEVAKLKDAGELEDLSDAEISALVMNNLMEQNPKAYADPSLDFDSILKFIEFLLPIILKLLPLFI